MNLFLLCVSGFFCVQHAPIPVSLLKSLCVLLFSLQDIQQVKTPEELENFMLKHGENIIDTLGAEVDRLEKELKVPKHKTKLYTWKRFFLPFQSGYLLEFICILKVLCKHRQAVSNSVVPP